MNEDRSLNFIEEIIESDLTAGRHNTIRTRFPPEPNGYLHLGHASSICLNFGLAIKYNGKTNLRFDDTNPVTEETEYVDSIKNDVKWLGFNWDKELYASDYFEILYQYAVKLIEKGLAYVDDSSSQAIAEEKGTPTEPGRRNRYAERTKEENLQLFSEMRQGHYGDGEKVLRAKIDMSSSNMLMRDPILYRIKHVEHHRTGGDWCIYPMYDFAHGQSDSIEGITHSICTMEFVPHREVYDWLIEHLEIFPSKQYEFARRNITYTVMSKRKLLLLVNEGYVSGWDDPRMPTISGIRRRGFTASSVRSFCERIGIGKRENQVDIGLLEFFVREELNKTAQRRMVVTDPLKVVITNFNQPQEWILSENNPEENDTTQRSIAFTKELWIERDDFMEHPAKKFFRLSPGQMVRLKSAFIIRCDEVEKNEAGEITALFCTYFPESRSGQDTSGLQVKATLHWVSAVDAVPVELRLYDRLFTVESVDAAEGDFKDYINANSLQVISQALAEPAVRNAQPGQAFQFLRKGYFCLDRDSTEETLVFNRTVTLKDTWAREQKK
jgi:glutaminyl-tRNA synthetase